MNLRKSLSTRRKLSHLLTGSIIAIFIVISPLIFYIYKCFPSVEVWETSYFTIHSVYFQDVQAYAWTFFSKFVVLYLLIIWFITCKHWWVHAIFVPISMYIHQLLRLLNDEHFFKDEFERWYTIPIIITFLVALSIIRKQLKNKILIIDMTQEIDKEIEKLKNNG